MSGHVDAPSGKSVIVASPITDAAGLAYYSVAPGLAALAPRGWHCIDIYGSNGADLLITPQVLTTEAAVAAIQTRTLDGPAVVLTFSLGFTSGREEVASVVSRVFPAHRQLVRNAAANDETAPVYPGRFPTDDLRYLSHESLEFITPAKKQGLGTLLAPLKPTTQPISGVQILVKESGDCCDLVSLSIRLPHEYSNLIPAIIHQVQRESRKER